MLSVRWSSGGTLKKAGLQRWSAVWGVKGRGACHRLLQHSFKITAATGEGAQLHLAVCGEVHIAYCLVLTSHGRYSSRGRPISVVLLLFLLLAALLMRLPALTFLQLAKMLSDVRASICVDDTLYLLPTQTLALPAWQPP